MRKTMTDQSDPVVFDKKPCTLELEPGTYWWCSCGRSASQPFCDGSHKGTDFAPVELTITEKEEVWLCNCKHSAKPPYCDGSHKKL